MSAGEEAWTQAWRKTSANTWTGKGNPQNINWQNTWPDEIKFYALDTRSSVPADTGEIWDCHYPAEYEWISEKMGDDVSVLPKKAYFQDNVKLTTFMHETTAVQNSGLYMSVNQEVDGKQCERVIHAQLE